MAKFTVILSLLIAAIAALTTTAFAPQPMSGKFQKHHEAAEFVFHAAVGRVEHAFSRQGQCWMRLWRVLLLVNTTPIYVGYLIGPPERSSQGQSSLTLRTGHGLTTYCCNSHGVDDDVSICTIWILILANLSVFKYFASSSYQYGRHLLSFLSTLRLMLVTVNQSNLLFVVSSVK